MAAKQKIKKTKTTTAWKRKTGGSFGYRKCNICHGTGRVKVKKK